MNNSYVPASHASGTVQSLGFEHIIWMISGIWTIGANALILSCFYMNRRRQWTGFSRQVCSMTWGDFLSGCTLINYVLLHLYGTNPALCTLSFYLYLSSQCVSILHILGICIFRNMKMKNMTILESQRRTSKVTTYIIASSWVLSFIAMMIPIVLWANFSGSPITCSTRTIFGERHSDTMLYIASFYCLSQLITNVLYVVAVCVLRKKMRLILPTSRGIVTSPRPSTTLQPMEQHSMPTKSTALKCDSQDQRQSSDTTIQDSQAVNTISSHLYANNVNSVTSQPALSILKNYRAILITTGFVLLVFDIFTLPFTISFFTTSTSPAGYFRAVGVILMSLNSTVNPIVYATRITSIRRAVKKLFQNCTNPCRMGQ